MNIFLAKTTPFLGVFYFKRVKKWILPFTYNMLLFTFGNTETVVLTLDEKKTLTSGYYLFIFDNVTTKSQVTKIFSFAEDESPYPVRYNQFTINVDTLFSGHNTGHWTYSIYEQSSYSNTDPSGLNEVENGIMQLKPASAFSFIENSGATTFKEYAG